MVTSPSTTRFPARHQSQRLEAAGARRIVFQQKIIHVERTEKSFGNRVVGALGVPAAAAVAAADVGRHGDFPARNIFQQRIVAGDGFLELLIRIQTIALQPAALD